VAVSVAVLAIFTGNYNSMLCYLRKLLSCHFTLLTSSSSIFVSVSSIMIYIHTYIRDTMCLIARNCCSYVWFNSVVGSIESRNLHCYPHMPIGKVLIYRLLFVCFFVCLCVCTVTDLSAKDKASGAKFCIIVRQRPGQGISHFCELCSPRSPKSDKSASAWWTMNLPVSAYQVCVACGHRIGMCGYTSVPKDGHTCWTSPLDWATEVPTALYTLSSKKGNRAKHVCQKNCLS